MRLLFYPDVRVVKTRIGVALSHIPDITTGNKEDFDKCFYWNYKDVSVTDSTLRGWVEDGKTVYNHELTNVTKMSVEECFKWAFGYSSLVANGYNGRCVSKANKQSRGAVREVACQKEKNINKGLHRYSDEYRIHQKIIDTSDCGICVEHRVFIFGMNMFVVEKTKPVGRRYRSNAIGYRIMDTADVFSKEEIDSILLFCSAAGLDFGEIDVLRDKDGKIYIVDINNIAGGGGPWTVADGGKIFGAYIKHLKQMLYANTDSSS